MVKKTTGIETILREASKNLLRSVQSQTEQYMAQLKEMNIKNDIKLQQVIRKTEGQQRLGGRRESGTSLGLKQNEEEKSVSPDRSKKESFFKRGLIKAAGMANTAVSEMQ
jgi:hypothetical protein